MDITKKKTEIIFTDGDLAIITTIKKNLPTTKHKLCLWHMQRNIQKNLSYLKRLKNDKFKEIYEEIILLLNSDNYEDSYSKIVNKLDVVSEQKLHSDIKLNIQKKQLINKKKFILVIKRLLKIIKIITRLDCRNKYFKLFKLPIKH
jgi:hypothetical protein